MVERWLKIVNKSGNKEDILICIKKILDGNLDGLDIKKLDGKKDFYRCRIGKFRIIFQKKDGEYFVVKVGYRGDIY